MVERENAAPRWQKAGAWLIQSLLDYLLLLYVLAVLAGIGYLAATWQS